ncbi:hypothetical protein WR25_06846 [Diploscapter pachys]|uniref:LEM domain-containing protein n=1 Tax=Diploscapter pachys TaxID=2018661 RepID=A0A2A2L5C2_9BILA|nr:hypothetical protein WR25_06846 [Diploscapter pachys]
MTGSGTGTGIGVDEKNKVLHLLAASESENAVHAARHLLSLFIFVFLISHESITGRREVSVRETAEDGLTALHVAAYFGRKSFCQLLLNFGADPLYHDSFGRTPLSMSQGECKQILRDHLKLVQQRRGPAIARIFSCHRAQRPPRFDSLHPANSDNITTRPATKIGRGLRVVRRKIRNSFNRIKGKSPDRKSVEDEEGSKNGATAQGDWQRQDSISWSTKLGPLNELNPQAEFPPRFVAGGYTQNGSAQPATLNGISGKLHHPIRPSYYDTPQARAAGLRKMPSAPAATPPQKRKSIDHRSPVAEHNSTEYFSAEDMSFNVTELRNRFSKTKLSNADDHTRIVNIDDCEMRRIKGLKDIELRSQLKEVGIVAGPICSRTRRLYEKKLYEARKEMKEAIGDKYSRQLELAVKGQLSEDRGKLLNEQLRPLQHLIEAKKEREAKSAKLRTNAKLRRIDSLWTKGHGVGRLEIGHGISDEEAFVIEAALIDALRVDNLTNMKSGEWHGLSKSWDASMKAELGVHLLYRAFAALHAEGVRVVHVDSLPGASASTPSNAPVQSGRQPNRKK